MPEEYYFEFTKIYGRLMRLEIQMKHLLVSSVLSYYKDDVIKAFERFFYNKERLKRYNHKNGNSFLAILKNPQIRHDSQKYIKLVNIMFLSDVLFMILCCEQFRKEDIVRNFYFKVPDKYGQLVKSRILLTDLRNDIAHYNFKDYVQNRKKYLSALLLFEIHICRNRKGLSGIPIFKDKPTIKTILLVLKELCPDLCEINFNAQDGHLYGKHRLLLDLCDDIALYNGYDMNELPSPLIVFNEIQLLKSP